MATINPYPAQNSHHLFWPQLNYSSSSNSSSWPRYNLFR